MRPTYPTKCAYVELKSGGVLRPWAAVCEKALADYMESKRRAFPRFYFVSTADLLDILSNGNNPVKVMGHMNKCFQAIEKLTLEEGTTAQGSRPNSTVGRCRSTL